MKSKIDEVVTTSNLRLAAGSRSYSRGEDYFQRGAVHHLYCDGEQLTADVNGTHVYRVRITNDDGRLDGECSCPVGRDGDFCKHLVALGLTYLDRQKNAPAENNKSVFSWKDCLRKCDKDELIKIILEMGWMVTGPAVCHPEGSRICPIAEHRFHPAMVERRSL